MDNQIQTSMDWAGVQQRIEAPVIKMKRYGHQMMKISRNIGLMVTELSKEEINCRRQGKQTRQHKELLAEINEEIANFERYLTFGVLLSG